MANNQTFTLNIKALFDASDIRAKVGDIQNAFKSLKLPDNLKNSLQSSFSGVEKALNDFESRAAKGVKTKADASGLTRSMDKVIGEFTKLGGIVDKVKTEINNTSDLSKIIQIDDATIQRIGKLKKEISDLQSQISEINASRISELENILNKISGKKAGEYGKQALNLFNQGDIQGAINLLDEIIKRYDKLQGGGEESGSRFGGIIAGFKELKGAMEGAKTDVAPLMDEINQKSQQIGSEMSGAFEKTNKAVNDGATALNNCTSQVSGARQEVDGLGKAQAQLNTELEQVKSRIVYFLGLSNAVNLFKRSIHSAFETVKELDAAMTETAVVTDKTISDMWKQLPEYTKRANELGVTTLDAYKSATLYYQQGLNDQQTAELSIETLKMARIAGLDAAEATDRMTNALRGFNMELNTVNAQRIDDVYSQLAAMSASDVDEISTAMTKVASLAHNANMDFETTSAFLAQIIETTRESAETAGTALKTVVARFSEVKKLVSEDQLKGTDEEGQLIDVNKVSQALRTAGIDLNKYFVGEVGLDDIFMELASKWDSLTSVQQRYIATQAAGSRQQSRFIAMMQDYARTQELVSAAYNANGASAKQFEKTQDSLQSKLARLKNAWNEFLMGITNNVIIKSAVDALTLLLNVINKLTGAFGPAISGFLKFGVAAGTLIGLRKTFVTGSGLTKLLGGLGNSPVGKLFGLSGNNIGTANVEVKSATEAGGILVKAATEAGGIAVKAATEAAAVEVAGEKTGAGVEVAGEKAAAAVEVAGEEAGAAVEVAGEKAGATISAASGKGSSFSLLGLGKKAGTGIWGAAKNVGAFLGIGSGGSAALSASGGMSWLAGGGTAAGIAGLGVFAAGVAAVGLAAWAAYKGIKALYDASPEGQLKKAKKYAESISKISDNAQKAASEIKEVQKTSQDYEDQLSNVTDPAERAKIISDQNDYILSLLEKDSTYSQYIQSTYTEGGQLYLTLDSNALAEAVDKIAEGAIKASSYNQIGQALISQQTVDLYKDRIEDIKKIVEVGGHLGDWEITEVDWEKGTFSRRNASLGPVLTNTEPTERIDNIEEYYGNELDLRELHLYENYLAQAEQQRQNFISLASKQLLDLSYDDLDVDSKKITTAVFSQFIDLDELQEQIDKQKGLYSNFDNNALALVYQDMFGEPIEVDSSNKDDIVNAIAIGDVASGEFEKVAQDIIDFINKENGKALLEIVTGTYEGSKENAESIVRSITDEQKSAIAKIVGKGQEEIDDFLTDSIEQNFKNQESFRNKTYKKIESKYGKNDRIAQNINQIFSLEDVKLLSNFADQWDEYNENFNTILYDKLLPLIENGLLDEQAKQFFENINNNPIETYAFLKDVQKNNTFGFDIADQLLNADKKQFSSSNLLQYYLTSEDYSSLSESISKLIEENGKITGDNIKELAKDSKLLSTMLDADILSANGLAKAITAFEAGNITITDLNSNVVDLFNSYNILADSVEHAGYIIKNFNPGEDYNDSMSFYSDAIEKMAEMVESRQFNNPALQNYWKLFLGDPPDPNDIEAWERGIEILQTAAGRSGLDFWTNTLGFNSQQVGEDIWVDYDIEGFKESGKSSYREYLKSLLGEDGLSFTDEFYDLMIRNAAKQGGSGFEEIATIELQKMMEAYQGAAPSKSDIQAIADAYSLDPQKLLDIAFGEGTYKFEDLSDRSLFDFQSFAQNIIDTVPISKIGKTLLENNEGLSGAFITALGIDENGNFSIDTVTAKIGEFLVEIGEGDISPEEYLAEYFEDVGPISVPVTFTVTTDKGEDYDVSGVAEVSSWEDLQKLYETIGNIQKGFQGKQLGTLGRFLKDAGMTDIVPNLTITEHNNEETPVNFAGPTIIEPIEAPVEVDDTKLQELEDKTMTLTAEVEVTKIEVSDTSWANALYGGKGSLMSTQAKGGTVKSAANGSIEPGLALTGEEEPEIVWNKEKGYAYLTGKNGPEIQNLQPGDQVFNGKQTKQILKRSGISSFAKGTINSYFGADDIAKIVYQTTNSLPSSFNGLWSGLAGKKTSGSGSGGKQKSSEEWKNELDWLYDLMEDIAEEEHKQTLIQAEYELAEKDLSKTGRDLYNLTKAELDTLQAQLSAQQFAFEKRLQQMNELQQKVVAEGFEEYLRWNPEDNSLEIDWDKINEITDKDTYDKLSELVSDMEKVQDQMDEAQEATLDIKKQIQELQTRYLQAYLDFQNRVMEALVAQYQQNIDSLSELNNTINDANQSILDSIQKEIDLQRQIRDNTDTEKEIADMEARLAMLQRDTTGANQQEILELQKQLDEARENYSDTLIDQAIDRLSQNNDDAQEQREKQIELLEAQLEYWQETGALWEEVADLIATGFTPQGSIIEGSTLWEFLKDKDSWRGLSQAQKDNWANELILESAQVGAYLIQLNDGTEVSTDRIIDSIIGEHGLAGEITAETRIVRAQLNELIAKLGGTPIDSIPGEGGYASGGLATKTGYAMLHGTTNEPEYVLNARQTGAFLRLADVLPSIFGADSNSTNNIGGNIYVELNMNVGEIGSDYDVDRLVARVKDDIYDASSYRNVNAVSFLR